MDPKRNVIIKGLSIRPDKLKFGDQFPWEALLGMSKDARDMLDWSQLTLKAPFEFIRKTQKTLPWNWRVLSQSAKIRWDYIIIHNLPWVYLVLHNRADFSFEFYTNNIQNYPWSHSEISKLPDFPLAILPQFPHLNWHWDSICARRGYTLGFANDHGLPMHIKAACIRFKPEMFEEFPNVQWDFSELAKYTNQDFYESTKDDPRWTRQALSFVKWDVFDKLDCGDWDYEALSKNQNLRVEHLRRPGDWNLALASRVVPLEELFASPDLNWDYELVARRAAMSEDLLIENHDCDWPWHKLHEYHWFSPLLALRFEKKPWDFQGVLDSSPRSLIDHMINGLGCLLANCSLSYATRYAGLSTVKKNPDLAWDWYYLARNAPLTSLDIAALPKIRPELVVENPFYVDVCGSMVDGMEDL